MRIKAAVYFTAILICAMGQAYSDDISRASRVIEWLGEDHYFESGISFTEDGSAIPQIGGGMMVEHPIRPPEKQRYRWELIKQAEILAMCGDDGIESVLGALAHQDYYVRVIAALALDKMLSVEYARNLFMVNDKKELCRRLSKSGFNCLSKSGQVLLTF